MDVLDGRVGCSTAGVLTLQAIIKEGANSMQKLSVEILLQQLEKTQQYFITTFKVQVVYRIFFQL